MNEEDPWWLDDLGSQLEALADRLEAQYGDCCVVDRQSLGNGGIRSVWFTASDPNASPTGWFDFGTELQVYAGSGQNGGRWELTRTAEDVQFVERIVTSVVQGRVTEVFGPSRSRVQVTFSDGTVATETGAVAPVGCLPVPGWLRRGRSVSYSPYRT